VVLDFGDGTEALLMHLQHDSSELQVGDVVRQGDVVGKVGLTGWVCGAHLHFQIQSTCDSWWCQSKPALFVDVGDPAEGVPLESNNCPVAEPCAATLDGTTTTIDDADARCFTKISSWFWPADGGWEDGHLYTWANDGAEPDTLGRWDFGVDVPGRYRLEAYVPGTPVGSQQARYEIHTGAEVIALPPVDQSAHEGWVDLGAHELVAGDEHWVRLADNTGEPRDLDREVAFDAIRWQWEPEASGTEGGDSSDGDDDPTPTTSDGGEVGGDAPPATSGGLDDGGPSLPPGSAQDDAGGGCSTAAPRGTLALFVPVLVALGRRRRSSRSRRTGP